MSVLGDGVTQILSLTNARATALYRESERMRTEADVMEQEVLRLRQVSLAKEHEADALLSR